MAWTTPITWTTGQVVTAAQLNTHIKDNENYLRAFHGARMWESAAESQTATGAWQLVTWDTTDYDTDSFAVLGSEWFVVPTGFDGYYVMGAAMDWAANATGIRRLRFVKNETYTTRTPNGVGTVLSHGEEAAAAAGGAGVLTIARGQHPLVAGDHVTLEALQSSGGNLAFNTPSISSTFFDLHYLGS